jgi:hypothetical protein
MIRTAGKSCSGVDSRMATESASVSDGVNDVWRDEVRLCRTETSRTKELHRLNKLVLLRQIDNHDRLNVLPVRRISEHSGASEQERDRKHHAGERSRELLRLAHRFGDGDDQPDAFEGEYGGADEKRERVLVEQLDLGDTPLGKHGCFVPADVDD